MDSHRQGEEPAFSGIFSRTFLLVAALALLAAFWLRPRLLGGLDPDAVPRAVTPRGDLAADEQATIEIFEASAPSVVHIQTSRYEVGLSHARFYEEAEGAGSGFLWDEAGHVVTNYHVIQGAEAASVFLNDGTKLAARLVGASPDFDLAVLQVDSWNHAFRPIPIGTSGDLRVGQKVFAIGNPFGLDQTLTTGVISGLDRAIMSVGQLEIRGVIQTDAAINPGNSGGPLLDSAGRLIGVNTAIKSPTGTNAGVGFAVPVDTVNRVVPRILAEGVVERAGLGVLLGPDQWAAEAGVQGAVIRYVYRGSAADLSGIHGSREKDDGSVVLGDVIVGLEDQPIHSGRELYEALESYREGQVVRVKVTRFESGEPRVEELTVELQELE